MKRIRFFTFRFGKNACITSLSSLRVVKWGIVYTNAEAGNNLVWAQSLSIDWRLTTPRPSPTLAFGMDSQAIN